MRLGKQTRFLPAIDNGSMSILDVGCGEGEVSLAILAKLDTTTRLEYIGIDKKPSGIRNCPSLVGRNGRVESADFLG